MDLIPHLLRQMAFSRATFGPGPRTEGVLDHIRKECDEIEGVYAPSEGGDGPPSEEDLHYESAFEWVDNALLSLDGMWRAVAAGRPDWSPRQVAEEVARIIEHKQSKNEMRTWPDWRTMSADKAIEHDRSKE